MPHPNRLDKVKEEVMDFLLDTSGAAALQMKEIPILVSELQTVLNTYTERYLPDSKFAPETFHKDLAIFCRRYAEYTDLSDAKPEGFFKFANKDAIYKDADEAADALAPIIEGFFVKHLGNPPEISELSPVNKIKQIVGDGAFGSRTDIAKS